MIRKFLTVAVIVCAVMLSFASVGFADTADISWYNEANTEFTLTTAEQLEGFASLVNGGNSFEGKTVKLGADIDLAGKKWVGIGVYSEKAIGTAFRGVFDGDGKTISNVTFANTSYNKYRGFFNQIYRATVKNVTIECVGFESKLDSSQGGAVIAGHAIGSTIEGCVAKGALSGTHNVAGIVVLIQGSTIKNCTNEAALTNNYSKLGGIVNFSQHKGVDSENKASLIEGCINKGTVSSTGDGANGVGGIIAWIGYGDGAASSDAAYAVTIRNCENKGTITATGTAPCGQIIGSGESYVVDGGANKGLATALGIGSDNQGQYFAYATVEDSVATYTGTLEAGQTYLVTAKGAKPVIKLAANKSITFDTSLLSINESGITSDYEIKETTEGNKTTYTAFAPEAKIGDVEYATLAEAVEKATAGDTVELISDIELNATVIIPKEKSITLDLAGKAVTVVKNGDRSLYALDNKGTLTLTDTVGNGSITARGNYNYGTMIMNGGIVIACDTNGGYGIWNYGNFTMNGGEIKVTHVGSYADQYGPTGLGNESDAAALITGGVFNGKNARAYIIASSGTLTITPAEGKEVKVYAPRGVSINGGTAVINGGTFEVYDANKVEGSYVAFETYYPLYIGGGQSVTVNGGDFLAPDQSVWNEGKVDVSINGGYFNTSISGKDEGHANDKITIYGGVYEVKPEEKFFAEGFEVVEKEDGTFEVAEKTEVVKTIGSKSAVLRYLDEGTNKYRFLIFTGIDNLNYKEVGYIISTTDGKSVTKSTKSVYTKITVNNNPYTGTSFSADNGSYNANYIFYQGISFSDLEYIKEKGISYTPYAITSDGTTIYGETRTFEKIEK